MGFFAPTFLFLLSLASIPLIIHLIQRIRLKKVHYSSLFFLSETKRETFSWLQLKEILLLIFRTLFIFFLFFSLARPYLKKKIVASQYEASRIIILDDSYSMSFNNNFAKAKNSAKRLVKELRKGSEAAVLLSSDNTKTSLTSNLNYLDNFLDSVLVSNSGNGLQSVFDHAYNLLQNSTLPRKEVFIITDLQKRAVMPVINRITQITNRPEITIIDVGSKDVSNVGIEEVALSPSMPTEDFPSKLKIKIKNFSNISEKRSVSTALKFSQAESVIQSIRTEVTINPTETKTLTLDAEIRKPGTYRAEIILSPDSLDNDDKRFFIAAIPPKTSILLLYENLDDIKYVEMALKTSYFDIGIAKINTLRQLNLKRYKAIGLFSPSSLTLADWQRLGYYLLDGGGLFICYNREMKEKQWDKALNTDLKLNGVQAIIKSPGFVTIEKVNYQNPVTEIFQDVDLSTAKFYSYWDASELSQSNVLAYFSSGKPFLLEDKNRKLIIALSAFDIQTTDFMFKATFLPMIHRIFTYLSFPVLKYNYQIGDTIFTEVSTATSIKIKTPSSEFVQSSILENGKNTIKVWDTKRPGFYQINNENFTVNVLAEEGDLTKVSDKEIKNQNIRIINDVSGKITDLSSITLFWAMLFFILELVLLVI